MRARELESLRCSLRWTGKDLTKLPKHIRALIKAAQAWSDGLIYVADLENAARTYVEAERAKGRP